MDRGFHNHRRKGQGGEETANNGYGFYLLTIGNRIFYDPQG